MLGKEKTGEVTLQKFPEEFYRVYKRQLVCAEYGSKKLLNMLENVSEVEVRYVVELSWVFMSISIT